jgi:hypothetical protein
MKVTKKIDGHYGRKKERKKKENVEKQNFMKM